MPVTVYDPANDRTREVLREMLKENTGRHKLDSGGAYGRNWERNSAEDFDSHPNAEADWAISTWRKDAPPSLEANVTLDLYHFLAERLEFLPERQGELDAIAEENPDESWFEIAAHYVEHLGELHDLHGPMGSSEPMTVNTYNHESLLSQTIQYTLVEDPGEQDGGTYLCILQVHGGCDVRGGYTAPKVFRTWELDMLSDGCCEIACSHCHDRNGLWLYEGYGSSYTEAADGRNLFDFPVQAYQPDEGFRRFLRRWLGDDFGTPGIVIVDEDANRASCPVCGKGELEIWAPPTN
jgi:hypothetical protein